MKAALVMVVVAACSGAQSPPPPGVANAVPRPPPDAAVDAPLTGTAAIIARLAEFRDAMCACTDRACSERVMEGLTRWAQDLAREAQGGRHPTEAEAAQLRM